MVVATDGPAARAVVLERFDERGFCFWTSSESPTGEQLAANPRAALVWLWDGRQARAEGAVERVSDEENDVHWRRRVGTPRDRPPPVRNSLIPTIRTGR